MAEKHIFLMNSELLTTYFVLRGKKFNKRKNYRDMKNSSGEYLYSIEQISALDRGLLLLIDMSEILNPDLSPLIMNKVIDVLMSFKVGSISELLKFAKVLIIKIER